MESGTNAFKDHTFSTDNDSSSSNSTQSTEHLVTQLKAANVTWMAYQEGMAQKCPINSAGMYAAKHDPFIFFQDVAGNPPSSTNAYCASHHKPLTALAADLQAEAVAQYNFITPDVCHDMHGDNGCSQANTTSANIKAGDDWLKANLPPIIAYALAHDGVVFLTWDEGDGTNLMPFIAIGNWAKKGYAGAVKYTHSSLLKSEEEIFGVPVLATVQSASDFADLFQPGHFP
jgi:phospholipase C